MISPILLSILILMVISLVAMIIMLRYFASKTIYAYRNILLIAGVLYMSLQIGVLISYFVSCIKNHIIGSKRYFFTIVSTFPRDFAYFAIPVLIIVCSMLLVSNIALIRHEGFRMTNLTGAILGGLYIGGTVAIIVLCDLMYNHILTPLGAVERDIISTVFTYFKMCLMMIMSYFECILIASAILGYVASTHVPSHDKDYIIILGCLISKEGGLLPLLKGRTNRAIRFAWEQEIDTGHKLSFVPSGGQGPNEVISEGSAMELYLLSHGAEDNEILAEKEATNTYENMLLSKRIIDRINPDAKIAFATTNYHVLRSGIMARRAGFNAEGISSKTKWYFWSNGFVREFFGILAINKKAHIFTISACVAINIILGFIDYLN